MNFPKRWSSLFVYHQEKIDQGICGIYDPEDPNRTFSILLLPNEESKKKIHKKLLESIDKLPNSLISKLYIQNEENIHFSVQWCNKRKIKGGKRENIMNELVGLVSEMNSISGELYLPFMGYGNLYGLLKTEQIMEFVRIRESLQSIFDSNLLKTGIPNEDFDLIHTSLVRSYSELNNVDRNELKAISMQMVDVVLDHIVIAFNDKVFNSDRTEILYTKKL